MDEIPSIKQSLDKLFEKKGKPNSPEFTKRVESILDRECYQRCPWCGKPVMLRRVR